MIYTMARIEPAVVIPLELHSLCHHSQQHHSDSHAAVGPRILKCQTAEGPQAAQVPGFHVVSTTPASKNPKEV